ncbi:hypothetical protein AB5N19_03519 [Seiridium cardinale]
MMQDIFSRADMIIAWLGLPDPDSDLVMDAIRARSRNVGGNNDGGWSVQKAVKSFVRRPYFQRMWIVQEVLLSPTVQVLCGPRFCLWDDMAKFILRKNWPSEMAIPGTTDALLSRWMDRSTPRSGNSQTSLHAMIYDFHPAKCADPRDSVYALLGLVTAPRLGSSTLVADYTISTAQLYHQTLGHLSKSLGRPEDYLDREILKLKLRTALRLPGDIGRLFHVVEMLSSSSSHGSMYEIELAFSDDEHGVLRIAHTFSAGTSLDGIVQQRLTACRILVWPGSETTIS